MNSSQSGTGSSSWNDQEESTAESNMHYQRRCPYPPRQTQMLEANFASNSHPDETQCHNIARESGLTPLQVKFWFQNKRTSTKALTRRTENNVLRKENERIRFENQFLRGRLVGRPCVNCGSMCCMEDHNLLRENFDLQQAMFQVQAFLREKGVDPNAPLDTPYEVNSNAPKGINVQNVTPEPSVGSSYPPQYVPNLMPLLGLHGAAPTLLFDQNMFRSCPDDPLGGNLCNPTPQQNGDSSFPPQHDGMIPTAAQGGGNEVNSTVPHVGNFWNSNLEWNPTDVAGSNGVDPTTFFGGNTLDPIARLHRSMGESTSFYEINAWNPNPIPTVAPSIPPPLYVDTEIGERLNTEEWVDSSTGEANLP